MNGEKYDFSNEVLERGNELFKIFLELQKTLQKAYIKRFYVTSDSDLLSFNEMLVEILEEFDFCWAYYENVYVKELMEIEKKARRFIVEAINFE